ncbi:hypothetical protein BHE74_00003032 [Ensete ventricosum]|nr:hypothetical protein BHE74_00003032 [Ensete ventricosum]
MLPRLPLFLIASNKEKTTMKKSRPCEVLLIRNVVPRFSSHRCLRPSEKNAAKKSNHCLAVREPHHSRFSLFLFLLPCFFSLFLATIKL